MDEDRKDRAERDEELKRLNADPSIPVDPLNQFDPSHQNPTHDDFQSPDLEHPTPNPNDPHYRPNPMRPD